jgi:enoyl-[acyl-carrier protein] reductase/trans-2-enoyl-CoA reductase (NAD+)
MTPEVQGEIDELWAKVDTENLLSLADVEGYETSFLRLFGFGLEGVDYAAETDPNVRVPSLA